MVKSVGLALCVMSLAMGLKAEQIEISSKSFYANESELKSEFIGNVVVKRANDELSADKTVIYFNKKREPLKYEAIGSAKFTATLKGKKYAGGAKKLIYDANKQIYTLLGDAHLKELDGDKNVYGERIVINQKDGTYNVESSNQKQPVRFIFNVKDRGEN